MKTSSESKQRKNRKNRFGHTDNADVAAYLETMRVREFSKATIDQSTYILGRFLSFIQSRECALQDATLDDLEAFELHLTNRPYAAMSIARFMTVVRQFFGWMEKTQRVFLNPARNLIVKMPHRPILFVPSEAQVKKLLAQPDVSTPLGIRDRAFMELIYATGTRLTEAASVSIFDPDFDRGVLRVLGKGRKERMVPLGKHAIFWMRQYLREARPKLIRDNIDEAAFWITRDGTKPKTPQSMQVVIADYSKQAGLRRISPHALRRACATHMLQHGAHPVQIQFLLGHANLNMLGQYLRVTINDLKKMHKASLPGH